MPISDSNGETTRKKAFFATSKVIADHNQAIRYLFIHC